MYAQRHFISEVQPNYMLAIREWFMHNRCQVHFSQPVQDVLNNTYHYKWIGTSGPVV
jgi:hypothetical protein